MNTLIPLVGGPVCGQSMQSSDGRLPNTFPVFFEDQFHQYSLVVEKGEDWTDVYYQSDNSKISFDPNNKI